MKNILIVFTGGTFSMMIDPKTGGAVPRFSGDELVAKIPEVKSLANITCFDFGQYPGPHMTPKLMMELSQTIKGEITNKDYDGVIVTHGTDTLEETAYLLDLTIETSIPIVVTGSMRNSSEPDWDGPRNLVNSLHVILSDNSNNMGILVCLNDEINAASEVTKIFSDGLGTFQSLDFGALGFIQQSRVIYNRLPRCLETIDTNGLNTNVDLITVYAGMNEKFFRFSADSGVEGIVVQALGVGNVPPAAFEGIKYASEKNIPIGLVSRCPAGETDYFYRFWFFTVV